MSDKQVAAGTAMGSTPSTVESSANAAQLVADAAALLQKAQDAQGELCRGGV